MDAYFTDIGVGGARNKTAEKPDERRETGHASSGLYHQRRAKYRDDDAQDIPEGGAFPEDPDA